MRKIEIEVGRALVLFIARSDERITEDEETGEWVAEYQFREHVGPGQYVKKWERLGEFQSEEDAAVALYVERRDFSAAYGA